MPLRPSVHQLDRHVIILGMQKSTYVIPDTALFLDRNLDKEYPLLIRDLPSEEKPREKLLAKGPEFLTPKELLAVILQVGTVKEELSVMADRLFESYGDQLFNERNPRKLSEEAEIPVVKACTIVALGELGRRAYSRKGEARKIIRNAKDVYEYLKDMRDLPQEQLRALCLNAHNKVILDQVISLGSPNSAATIAREVFRASIDIGAIGLVLAHNHPSGDPTPSAADVDMTGKLIEAGKIIGIRVLDHVIIAKDAFASVNADYS